MTKSQFALFWVDAWWVVKLHVTSYQYQSAVDRGQMSPELFAEWSSLAFAEIEELRAYHWTRDVLIEFVRGVQNVPLRAWLAFLGLFAVLALVRT